MTDKIHCEHCYNAGQDSILSKMKVCDIDKCENPAILKVCQEHTFEAGQESFNACKKHTEKAGTMTIRHRVIYCEECRKELIDDARKEFIENNADIQEGQLKIYIDNAKEAERQKILDRVKKIIEECKIEQPMIMEGAFGWQIILDWHRFRKELQALRDGKK